MVEDLNHDRQDSGSAEEGSTAAVPVAGSGRPRLRLFARFCRTLWRSCLCLLVAVTLVLVSGRLLMRVLDNQNERIAALLSERLGVPVQVGALDGRWTGLYPVLGIEGLALDLDPGRAGAETLLAGAEVELDPWRSLWRRQPVLRGIELQGLDLQLLQGPDGRWQVQGLAAGDGSMGDILLDLLLKTPSIRLVESTLQLQFAQGARFVLDSLYLSVLNAGEDHRAALQFRPGATASPVVLRLDIDGDLRSQFAGSFWMKLETLPLHESLASVLPDGWELQPSGLSASLWADFDNSGLRALRGEISQLDLQLELPGSRGSWPLSLANSSLDFRAGRQDDANGSSWRIEARDVASDVQGSPVDLPQLRLDLPLDAAAEWQLQVQRIELAPLVQALTSMPLPAAALEALLTLDPRGELENLVLVSTRDGSREDGFDLQANFRGLAVEAWKGAPSGSNLDGYLRASASKGVAEVDAHDVSMAMPGLFLDPWYYERLNARVWWETGPEGFRVTSNPIHVSSDRLRGVVQFGLDTMQPGWRTPYPELSLLVGMDYMDLGLRGAYLPQLQRISTTIDWLETALQQGAVHNSMLVLRTPTGGDPALASATHASWFEAAEVRLEFLPDWPHVDVGSARVLVRDETVAIEGADADIAGIRASAVRGNIERRPEGGSLLNLDIAATAPFGTGLDFLRDTPLRERVGNVLDDWRGDGELALSVDLGIGLGGEPLEPRVAVQAALANESLYLPVRSLQVDGISGELLFTSEEGLQARDLEARLFGSSARVDISTRQGSARGIRIDSRGKASVAALRDWEGQPDFVRRLLDNLEGGFDYSASLELPTGGSTAPAQLRLSSDLVGVASNLPPPYNKPAMTASTLDLGLMFSDAGSDLDLRYGGGLSGQIRLDADGVDRGYLYLGPLNQGFTIRQADRAAEGLLISGRLGALDYDAWAALAPSLQGSGGKGLKDYLRLIDVDLGRLQIGGQGLEDINVQVRHEGEAWRIQARNASLAGTLAVPDDAAEPWDVALEYLRLPPRRVTEPDEVVEDLDVLQGLDPASLPAFDFRTAELAVGEQQLGSWRFRFRPRAGGATLSDFHMEEAQSRITGSGEGAGQQAGALIEWDYASGAHQSSFAGVFSAADLSRVMPLWGHDANVVSRRAEFRGELQWPGSPLAFGLRKASGALTMRIENGRFVDIDSGSSRLLGAFNFDALVRRLELDFSDLFQRGFTFDLIRGDLDFVSGVVHTRTPLVISGPSSQLTITGEISLAAETIAADMLVRIPLSENISLLAGLLGAWPIAVSTYLASKIFAEQLDDFTTVIYRLEGPWSNPRAGFEAPEDNGSAGEATAPAGAAVEATGENLTP